MSLELKKERKKIIPVPIIHYTAFCETCHLRLPMSTGFDLSVADTDSFRLQIREEI